MLRPMKNNKFIPNFVKTHSLISKYMWPQTCKLLFVHTEICAKQLAGSQLKLEMCCHKVN